MKFKLGLIVGAVFTLTSCASRYYVETNTFSDTHIIPAGFPAGSSFALVSSSQKEEMQSKEVRQKIKKMLLGQGFHVTEEAQADYHLTFHLETLEEKKFVQVPQYLPGTSKTKEGHVGALIYKESEESGTMVYVTQELTSYKSTLSLSVFDKQQEEVWQASAQSDRRSDDFREALDYLLVSAFQYFGKSTHKKTHLTLKSSDEMVSWLRQTSLQ